MPHPKRTRLYDRHVALGARMVEFAGWLLPVQYPTGPKAEHLAVRTAAGVFDIDHMGQVNVSGPDALRFLQRVMTADVAEIDPWQANYSLMCYADGTIVDDVFIYQLDERYMVAINASNNRKDTRWLKTHATGFDVTIDNVSKSTYMLALQGPKAADCLQPIADGDLSQLLSHQTTRSQIAGVESLNGRTGYTGEDGFELYFPEQMAVTVWDAIMGAGKSHGLVPCGLAARDSLRLEPCLPLYGDEISASTNPLEAGLGWAVSFDKADFVGRDALMKVWLERPERRLVAFSMRDRGVPRHGYKVLHRDEVVGVVTSGIYSPTLDSFVGLAYVPSGLRSPGTEIDILIRGKAKHAVVVKKPFYVPAYRR